MDLCDFDNGWQSYGSMCYKYSTSKMTWYDAQAHCAANSGRLAVVDTSEKWGRVEDVVSCKDYQAGIWIGLSDTVRSCMQFA